MPTALGLARSVTLGALVLDQVDDAGVWWVTVDLTGWRGSPATTLQVTQRPADHGGWASANPKLVPRQMELKLYIEAPDTAAMTAAYEQLLAAAGTGPIVLQVTEDGITRQAVVHRNGDVLPTDDAGTWATYSVPLEATDPRRYGSATAVSLYLPSASGGLSWPVSWPISWPATVVSGDAVLGNAGTISAPMTITVYGPTTGSTALSQPLITVTGPDGATSTLLYADTIAPGDFLAIDCGARSVLYNGTSTRRGLLQVYGGWPTVPPGGAQISFRAGSYDSTVHADVTYRPAWT
jgi:hypothetical protein